MTWIFRAGSFRFDIFELVWMVCRLLFYFIPFSVIEVNTGDSSSNCACRLLRTVCVLVIRFGHHFSSGKNTIQSYILFPRNDTANYTVESIQNVDSEICQNLGDQIKLNWIEWNSTIVSCLCLAVQISTCTLLWSINPS